MFGEFNEVGIKNLTHQITVFGKIQWFSWITASSAYEDPFWDCYKPDLQNKYVRRKRLHPDFFFRVLVRKICVHRFFEELGFWALHARRDIENIQSRFLTISHYFLSNTCLIRQKNKRVSVMIWSTDNWYMRMAFWILVSFHSQAGPDPRARLRERKIDKKKA